MTRAVLIGGPYDGGEARLQYVPEVVGIFECLGRCGEKCSWKDRLHWTDWGEWDASTGRSTRYVLDEIADSYAQYVYGPIEDGYESRFAAWRKREPVAA